MNNITPYKKSLPEIFEKKGDLWTTSLDIAEKFQKNHRDVVRAIENLDMPQDFKLRNFAQLSRTIRGGTHDYYIISKWGFLYVAMSFTGKKASAWAIKYIDAFRKMEKDIEKKLKLYAMESFKHNIVTPLKEAISEYEAALKLAHIWNTPDAVGFALDTTKERTGIDLLAYRKFHYDQNRLINAISEQRARQRLNTMLHLVREEKNNIKKD